MSCTKILGRWLCAQWNGESGWHLHFIFFFQFAVLQNDAYYRLGGQVDDVVQSHVIGDMSRVYWCSITQKWEEA